MEAAKPIMEITPINNNDEEEKMIGIKTLNIESNNKAYKLELGKSQNKKKIIFKMSKSSSIASDYYFLVLNEEDFQNLNPIFKIYQNIDEIYSLLIDILNDRKYSLVEKEKLMVLTMKFNIYKGKEIDIEFNLKVKKAKKEDLIDNLYLLVNQLMEDNKLIKDDLNKKNNELKNEIILLKEEIINKDKEIINIKKELEEIKKGIMKNSNNTSQNYFDESIIIRKNEERQNLTSWISEKGKIKSINLLYRATRDGDTYKEFYNKCSNQGPTVSIINTKKGRKFGGFSFREWTDQRGILRIKDKEAFLYSLDNMKKYKILKPEVAIGCYSDHSSFLTYGNKADSCGIYLNTNFLKGKKGLRIIKVEYMMLVQIIVFLEKINLQFKK